MVEEEEAMETAQSLSIESFSYSWLVNLRPSLDSLDSSLRASLDAPCDEAASFIEMDPTMPPSKRFFHTSQDLNKFDFPTSQTPPLTALVHADEIFSDGYIVPLFVNRPTPTPQASSQREQIPDSGTKRRGRCLRRCRTRLSKRMFLKYLDFLRSLFSRIRGFNSCSKPEKPSPRTNDPWRKSFDSESSIYEAVLHCKQSIDLWYQQEAPEIVIKPVMHRARTNTSARSLQSGPIYISDDTPFAQR
ncbi:hypothetical protein V6N13_021667 [Hibiscus sabdariffa]